MKKFSLRHNYNTIELLGPLKHLKISIIYGHVNHNAVYSEVYWFMRFLNKHTASTPSCAAPPPRLYKFRQDGGELFMARGDLEKELKNVRTKQAELEEQVRSLCAGAAPLLLLRACYGDCVSANSLGMVFVRIPEPRGWFSVWETRIHDYEVFVKEGHWGRLWPMKPEFDQATNHPVVNVSWEDAKDFCIWLTQKERSMERLLTNQVYRLPTDLEWSKAAGLPLETELTAQRRSGRILGHYPWGTMVRKETEKPKPGKDLRADVPRDVLNCSGSEDGYKYTAPVGSFKPNALGIFDLGGNAWEWVIDFADDGRRHVVRGGSWANLALPSSVRDYTLPDGLIGDVGFRCVFVDAPSAP